MLTKKLQEALDEHMRKLASQGGKASSAKLTPEQRTERARAAGRARQAKRKASLMKHA